MTDSNKFPAMGRGAVLASLPSGEIRIEDGADGAWILFDCDCLDALPFCRAQCCYLIGTIVTEEEADKANIEAYWDERMKGLVIKRDADGGCSKLCRETRTCECYKSRPKACADFHCTRGPNVRGWPLNNHVSRLPM